MTAQIDQWSTRADGGPLASLVALAQMESEEASRAASLPTVKRLAIGKDRSEPWWQWSWGRVVAQLCQ